MRISNTQEDFKLVQNKLTAAERESKKSKCESMQSEIDYKSTLKRLNEELRVYKKRKMNVEELFEEREEANLGVGNEVNVPIVSNLPKGKILVR